MKNPFRTRVFVFVQPNQEVIFRVPFFRKPTITIEKIRLRKMRGYKADIVVYDEKC